ncbi:MAG: hypothetical protein ACQETR_10850 [Thermodesulfobacteriota bacterium]
MNPRHDQMILRNRLLRPGNTAGARGYIVYVCRIMKLIQTGMLLHLAACLGIMLFCTFCPLAMDAFYQKKWSHLAGYGWLAAYGFILPFFAELDALSRFQNYKQAKDLFYENGFKPRIANLYAGSRCQRDAAVVAAKDLGIGPEIIEHYQARGFKWYHVLPGALFSRPGILLTRNYWQRTLFEARYTSRHF